MPYKDPEVRKQRARENYLKTYADPVKREKILSDNKKWAVDNRERMNELSRTHYHTGGSKEYQQQYRKDNKELYNEAQKKWRANNLDKDKQRQKEYREKNKEKERIRKAKYRAEQKIKYNIPDKFGGKAQALAKGILEEITGLTAREEVMFDWCKSRKNYHMRVDMYFEELNLLVEYNGQQHYKPIKFGGTRVEAVNKYYRQRKRDQLKYKLIRENGFNLLVIPYWEALSKKNLTRLLAEVMTK